VEESLEGMKETSSDGTFWEGITFEPAQKVIDVSKAPVEKARLPTAQKVATSIRLI
jgi:hypothetical protein